MFQVHSRLLLRGECKAKVPLVTFTSLNQGGSRLGAVILLEEDISHVG